jgi:hypothetical protein
MRGKNMGKKYLSGETKTYVELIYHSLIFSETSVEEVTSRDPQAVIENGNHKKAFGFRFFDQSRKEVELDGKTTIVHGEKRNISPWYYPGGQIFTLEDVKNLTPKKDYAILISNMEGNGYASVCKTRHGGFVPVEKEDVVL